MTDELTPRQVIWRYRIFIITWLGYAGFYLCRKNLSVIAPELKEWGLTDWQYANYIFVYSLMYCVGQFISGVLSDRYGPRIIVGTGLALSAAANLLLGFTGTEFLLVMFLCGLNGAGQSTGWSGLVKNMACWFRRKERGIVMAWWGTNYVLGGAIATALATYCVYRMPLFTAYGWRRGFWAPALLLLLIAAGYLLVTRNKPSDAGLPDFPEDDEADESGNRSPDSGPAAPPAPHTSISILREIVSKPAVWIISLMYFFLKMTRYAFLFWLPLYMAERLGYSGEEAGYTSTVFELVGFTGAVAAGYMSDKLFQSRRFPVGALFLWGLGLAFLVHPTIAGWGHLANAIGIGLIGFLTYGPDTLMTGAGAQDEGSQRGAATAAGIINGVGSMGQMLSGYIVATVKNAYGWDALFYLLVVCAFLSGALLAVKWNYVPVGKGGRGE
ncbi:MAG: MFS transporter [bacterium]